MTILSKSVAYRYLYFLADSAIPRCNYRAAMLITKTNKTVRFMLVTKLICLISSIATLGARQHHQRHRHHHHLSVAIIINIVRNEEKWKITSQAYYYLCFHLNFSLSTIAVERRASWEFIPQEDHIDKCLGVFFVSQEQPMTMQRVQRSMHA